MTVDASNRQPLLMATRRVANELHLVEARIEKIEGELDHLIERQAQKLSGETIGILQEVDFVRQSVNALALFVSELSGDASCSCAVDLSNALKKVPLRDLRAHLENGTRADRRCDTPEIF